MRTAGVLVLILVVAAAGMALWLRAPVHPWATQGSVASSPAPPARPAALPLEPRPLRPGVGFASKPQLVEHYRKHGREFGPVTMGRYLRLAQELRDRPPGGLVRESVRADGVVVRYDQATGAFIAFERDGTIRTFFRPAGGDAYFRGQLQRVR